MKEKDGGRVVLERTSKILQLLESGFHSQTVVQLEAREQEKWKRKGLSWRQSILDFSRLSFPHSVLYVIKKYINQECDRKWDSGQHG